LVSINFLAARHVKHRQQVLRDETNRHIQGQPRHLLQIDLTEWAKPDRDLVRRMAKNRKWGRLMDSTVVKRSIVVAGHKTSVILEDAFWQALKEIANDRQMTLSDLVATIDTVRRHGNLSSAIRLFVLDHFRAQIGDRQPNESTRRISAAHRPRSMLLADC
jgi:predicted DNA-binding ribbon-helix-helix protein